MANSCNISRDESEKITKTSLSTVWMFTNKKELNRSEFINYFERKIFRTIRKYQLLPLNKIFTLEESKNINTIILKKILETKFQVKFSKKPNTYSNNLSQVSEDIFKDIITGKFNHKAQISPLLNLTDKEIELYASLKNIKGISRKKNKMIQLLFSKFIKKNQDLEINILKAQEQLKK